MSAFDPNTFLDFTAETPNEKRPPLDVGEYVGIFSAPDMRTWVGQKDPTKSGIAADYLIEVQIPPEQKTKHGYKMDTIKVKYGIMLDTMPDGKSLDMSPGMNGGYRKLRDALDMNKPGDRFNLRMPEGRPVKVKISHREYPPGSGELFEEVAAIAKV